MATSPTKTVKISQTIMLDIDFSKVDSVRIVDVGIASKPALPETSTAPVARDVQRLDLSGDLANESR